MNSSIEVRMQNCAPNEGCVKALEVVARGGPREHYAEVKCPLWMCCAHRKTHIEPLALARSTIDVKAEFYGLHLGGLLWDLMSSS